MMVSKTNVFMPEEVLRELDQAVREANTSCIALHPQPSTLLPTRKE